MSLILPTVGQEPGPNWALDLNSSLSLVDQHNHAAGSGVPITPAGINIDTDLAINSHNLTSIRSSRFTAQLAPLALGTDIGCIYVAGQDLYYNDTLGNQIRLTIAGAVNGTPGSIGGLVAPATATYVPANQTFVWQSNLNTSASLDCGPILIRNIVAGSNAITLSPPNPLPANYTITLPTSAPASTKILTLSNTGAMAANYDVDYSTLTIAANTIKVANGGITQTQMANDSVGTNQIIDLNVTANKLATDSVTTSKIVDGNVTRVKLGPLGQQVSSSCGNFTVTPKGSWVDVTNLTITITTTGKPVFLMMQSDGSGGQSTIRVDTAAGGTPLGRVRFLRDGAEICQQLMGSTSTGEAISSQYAANISFVDAPAAGTYTYKVQAQIYNGAGFAMYVNLAKLIGYEL